MVNAVMCFSSSNCLAPKGSHPQQENRFSRVSLASAHCQSSVVTARDLGITTYHTHSLIVLVCEPQLPVWRSEGDFLEWFSLPAMCTPRTTLRPSAAAASTWRHLSSPVNGGYHVTFPQSSVFRALILTLVHVFNDSHRL